MHAPPTLLLWPLCLACALDAPDAQQYLAFQLSDGQYVVTPRDKGSLSDLQILAGDLGQVRTGGYVRMEDNGDSFYEGGRQLEIAYQTQDGVAVPLDEHGLLLWSFYGHLEDLSLELPQHGLDPEVFFPLDAAWTPVMPDFYLEMLPKENAAYATAGHFFILLDDIIAKDVPLAANAGIVRHEFGHALFHWLSTGGVLASAPFGLRETESSLYYASLHEGIADSVAALTLDDPDFFAASLPMDERNLTGNWVVADVQLPAAYLENASDSLLDFYDPYPLGTVFAATAWDLREALGSPDEALAIVLDGVRLWVEPGEMGDAWGMLDAWVQAAPSELAFDTLCESVRVRFEGVHQVEACAGSFAGEE